MQRMATHGLSVLYLVSGSIAVSGMSSHTARIESTMAQDTHYRAPPGPGESGGTRRALFCAHGREVDGALNHR